MPSTGRDLHVDVPLTNMVIGFEPQGVIVDQIFPMVNVMKQSDKYYTWDKRDFFRIPDTRRSPKTKGHTVEFNVSSDSYFADNYALVHEEPFEDMVNADQIISGREKKVRALKKLLMLDWENRIISLVTSTSNVGSSTTLSGTDQWSDEANSNPIKDIETGRSTIHATTGIEPNTLIIGRDVWIEMKHHPDFLDRIKYSEKGIVTTDLIASVLDLDRILIGSSIKENAGENLTSSMSNMWGKHALLCYVTKGPDPDGKDPSFGYSYRWTGALLGAPMAAEIWNDPDNKRFENRRVQYYQDEKIAASELGYLIVDAVA